MGLSFVDRKIEFFTWMSGSGPGFGGLRPRFAEKQRVASGDQSVVEPPGPIPNPEVKRCSADGSWAIGPARVGRCQVFARLLRKKEPGVFFAQGASCARLTACCL